LIIIFAERDGLQLKKLASSIIVSLIIFSLILPILLGININLNEQSSPIDSQSATESEHIDNLWAGKYYRFLAQTMRVDGNASLAVAGDLNQDNYSDIAVLSKPDGPISLFFWNESGQNFSYMPNSIITSFEDSIDELKFIVIDDISNDGINDLTIIWYNNSDGLNYLGLLIQTSPGEFTPQPSMPKEIPDDPITIIIDQFNADEGNDIAIVCRGSFDEGIIAFFFYLPAQSRFDTIEKIEPIGSGITTSCSISNNTLGNPSEIAVGFNSSQIKIYWSDFQSDNTYEISTSSGTIQNLRSGILNNDTSTELTDLLAITKSPNQACFFYFVDGLNKFPGNENFNFSLPFMPIDIALGDLNNDNLTDIAITSDDPRSATSLYFQNDTVSRWDSANYDNFSSIDNPISIVIADFDNDGLIDIGEVSSSNGSSSNVAIYFGKTGQNISASDFAFYFSENTIPYEFILGKFTRNETQIVILESSEADAKLYDINGTDLIEIFSFTTGPSPNRIAQGNLNNDSYNDFIIIDEKNNTVSVYLGAELSNISASPVDEFICAGIPTNLAIADLDNDRFDDVVVTTDGGGVYIFFNQINESVDILPISPIIKGETSYRYDAPASADLDSNGLKDLVYSRNHTDNPIVVHPHISARNIGLGITHSANSIIPTSIEIGDFNNDDKPDIAASDSAKSELRVLKQQGTMDFSLSFQTSTIAPITDLIAEDLTDTGRKDLLAIMPNASLAAIYVNELTGLSSDPEAALVLPSNTTRARVSDINFDGRTDIWTLSTGSKAISIWEQLNWAPAVNINPTFSGMEREEIILSIDVIDGISEPGSHTVYWDFGDGENLTIVGVYSTTHNYSSNGTYLLNVNVTDFEGLYSAVSSTVIVNDSVPEIISITILPTPLYEGNLTTLEAEVQSLETIIRYAWKVDGYEIYNGSSNITSFYCNISDDFFLKLIVWDIDSDNSSELSWPVSEAPPIGNIDALLYADEGDDIEFYASFSEELNADEVVWFEWDFNYEASNFNPTSNSSSPYAYHIFSATGDYVNYTTALKANDSDDSSALLFKNITIYDATPQADFNWTPTDLKEGVLITFMDTSSSYDLITDYYWEIENKSSGGFDIYSGSTVVTTLNNGTYAIHLRVNDSDGDSSWNNRSITVFGDIPIMDIVLNQSSDLMEFGEVWVVATIISFDQISTCDIINYSGVYDYQLNQIDAFTWIANFSITFEKPGMYEVAIIAYDVDDDWNISSFLQVDILDRLVTGTFSDIVSFERNAIDSSVINFNASDLLLLFPDNYTTIQWNWSDGTKPQFGLEASHNFIHESDYLIELLLIDDENNSVLLTMPLNLTAPTISIPGYGDIVIVKNNTVLSFTITDDKDSVFETAWSLNGGGFVSFQTNYRIDVDQWGEGEHTVLVKVEDSDGNVAVKEFTIVIDNISPSITITNHKSKSYVGDEINITVSISDPHIDPDKVFLHYSIGDLDMPDIQMLSAGNGSFYAIVPGPSRDGSLEFCVTAEDLAGNVGTTGEPIRIQIVNHLLTQIWPFASIGAVLAVIGLIALIRIEAMTAVDETFVIYEDGRLISHQTRRLHPGMDQDVLSGMFVAIQEFVKDSFKDDTIFDLRRLEFGEKMILVEKGKKIYLAVVVHGRQSRRLLNKMRLATREIESKFATPLEAWDGDIDNMRGVKDITRKLYTRGLLGVGEKWFKRAS